MHGHEQSQQQTVGRRPNTSLVWWVVVWIPAAMVVGALVVLALWLPRLPDEIAIHWGANGEPDGFAPAWANVLLTAVLGFGLVALLGGLTIGAARHSRAAAARYGGDPTGFTANARLTAAASPAVTAMLMLDMLWLTGGQLDGAEPDDISVPIVLLVGFAVAALVGFVAWRALPASTAHAAPVEPEAAIDIAPGETASWTTTVTSPWPVIAVASAGLVASFVPVALDPSLWPTSALLIAVFAVVLSMLAVRVSVDARGVRVHTLIGIRLTHVPIDQIVSAAAVEVSAFGDFGGWGYRLGVDGRRGVIVRSGAALQLERRSSGPVVITVDDARTGAALVNGLVAASARA